MGTEIERSNGNKQTLTPETGHSALLNVEWLNDQLTILAEAFQIAWTAQTQALYIEALADLPKQQLQQAVMRAVRELKFFPKIAELREMAGAGAEQQDAEARAGFDKALQFARRHVFTNPVDGDGICINQCFSRTCTIQEPHYMDAHLSQQLRDCVRRAGGWRAMAKTLRHPDPFLKKEFMAEWHAWLAVENVQHSLTGTIDVELKQLIESKSMRA